MTTATHIVNIRLTDDERTMVDEIIAKLSQSSKGARRITTSEAIRYAILAAHAEITRSRKGK